MSTFTNTDAWQYHKSIIEVIPQWNRRMIDQLYGYNDGVRAGWNMTGVISGEDLEKMRNELKAAVKRRKATVFSRQA